MSHFWLIEAMREVQPADVGGLHGSGLGAAVPGVAGDAAAWHLRPGQRLDPGIQQRLVHPVPGTGRRSGPTERAAGPGPPGQPA